MLPSLETRRLVVRVIAALVVAAAIWAYAFQPRPEPPSLEEADAARDSKRVASRPKSPVPIQDGKTIDFPGGSPVVKDTAADKAYLAATLKKMDAAAQKVTFPATVPTKK